MFINKGGPRKSGASRCRMELAPELLIVQMIFACVFGLFYLV